MLEPSKLAARMRSRRIVFVALAAVLAALVLVWTRAVLLPFILAVVVAYVLTPAVAWVERLRIPRWVAVILVYAVTIGTVYVSAAAAAPRLVVEMRALLQEVPRIAAGVRDQQMPALRRWLSSLTAGSAAVVVETKIQGEADDPADGRERGDAGDRPEKEDSSSAALRIIRRSDGSYDVDLGAGVEVQDLGEGRWRIAEVSSAQPRPIELGRLLNHALGRMMSYIQGNTLEALRLGQLIVGAISRSIFLFFMTLMLAAYMMITRERIVDFFRSLVFAEARSGFDVLLARVDRGLSGVVRGQLIICLVNGVLSAIGFALFQLKYWPILAILAGCMSIVPIFGSILSSVPIVAIALTQSLGTSVEVLLWILGIHQLEANVLNPKIIGDAAKIHPVLVVFSLLAGEHLYGIAGALLAVPTLSIAQSLFLHFRQAAYGDQAPTDSFIPPPARAPAGAKSVGARLGGTEERSADERSATERSATEQSTAETSTG